MLIVHRSNRVENLVASLADVVEASPPGPFDAEPIIVQGRGMERWLSMQLARRFGVWANPSFPFPRRFLLDLFDANLDSDAPSLAAFEPESLAWAIAARLPGLLQRGEFTALREYLGDGDDVARLLALASRIAATFDDYVVFRSEMIAEWEDGRGGGWEGTLWRALVRDLGRNHVAARAEALLAALRGGAAVELPRRVSLFGVSTLAPLYLRIFAELAGGDREVHLFVLSPTDQYWAELRDRREVLRELWRSHAEDVELEALLRREVGNRLLASLGRLGREFQAVLEGAVDYADAPASLYEDPAADASTALALVQSDMLALRYGGGRRAADLSPADGSIAVHSCHGPMREIQVLHDQLRDMFAADPTLRPRDVIVMTPRIDDYSPFIEAVFHAVDEGAPIPFRIADRGPSATSEVFEAFAEILRVLPGRMTSAEVIDLLRREVIRRRSGLGEAEIEVVREWVDRTRIRWGMDAAHRAEHGHDGGEQNTWEFGLRRLFLGYACGDGADESGGYAPFADVEGSTAAALGRLAELCQRLFAAARRLRTPPRIEEWPREVDRLLEDLVWQEGPAAFEAQALRAATQNIAARAAAAGYDGTLDLGTMAGLLEGELRLRARAHGFLGGDVTFCELVPMRTIPFRVVCLIGMDDGAFPRVERRADFDRMGEHHRWGDRSLRDDDRYMFLEAILSARDRLYVSYVGQDAQAGTAMPPSVVVQELLDVLDDMFEGYESEARVVRHPMQAFSPRYFAPEAALRSYSVAAFEGAAALVGERIAPSLFIASEVPWPPPAVVELEDFVRFFERPAREFLQKRMRIYLGNDAEVLDTREPLDLDDLEKWDIGNAMLSRTLAGQPCDFEMLARHGALPVGAIGRTIHEEILETVQRIAAPAGAGPLTAVEPVEIDVDLGSFRVAGTVAEVRDGVQQRFQYSKIGHRQELSLWVRHLLLCAAFPGAEIESRLCARQDARGAAMVYFGPIADPLPPLRVLARLYEEGMAAPLPLFETVSREYAKRLGDSKSETEARAAAARVYDKSLERFVDPYVIQIYGAAAPFRDAALVERSAAVARAVYEPFLAARKERKL